MMYAMEDKMNSLAPFPAWVKMKNVTVQDIFGNGPDGESKNKPSCKFQNGHLGFEQGLPKKVANYRDINDEGHVIANFGKTFHEVTFKHTYRCCGVGNKISFHGLNFYPFYDRFAWIIRKASFKLNIFNVWKPE